MPNGRRDEAAWSRIWDWLRRLWEPTAPAWGPSVQPVVPGQFPTFGGPSRRTAPPGPAGGSYRTAPPQPFTPSQGFGMIPRGGIQGPYAPTRATPGTIPAQEGWIQQAIGLTPVEAALARIGEMAAGQQPAEPERPEAQFPGYWEAIGQQPGDYPVPQGAVQGMWGPRKPWEEWSWKTRGIPLQGYEILRVEGGRMPWGGRGRGGRRRGGREEPEPEPPAWQPGAWSGTFS